MVEVAIKRDLVADDADLVVERVLLVGIDPCVCNMRQDFLFKVGFIERVDGLAGVEGDVLVVAQVTVGLVFDDLSILCEASVERIGFACLVNLLDDLRGLRVFP